MPSPENLQPSSNRPSFAEALAATQKMQQDWLEHGVNFVDLYVEDVDGDWLEQWGKDESVEKGAEIAGTEGIERSHTHESFIQSVVKFLMSDDPVAVEARPYWKARPLTEIAVHLEQCLALPESDRPYAIQDLLMNGHIHLNHHRLNNQVDNTDLAQNLLNKLLQI